MLKLVAFDVETANSRRSSLCAYGMARPDDGAPDGVRTHAELVNPGPGHPFLPRNVQVHGIKAGHVRGAPTIAQVWDRIAGALEWADVVIMHAAAFDKSCLAAVAAEWGLAMPRFRYACTVQLSRKAWPALPSHSLGVLSDAVGLGAFRHHDAGADAAQTVRVALLACRVLGRDDGDVEAACGTSGVRVRWSA